MFSFDCLSQYFSFTKTQTESLTVTHFWSCVCSVQTDLEKHAALLDGEVSWHLFTGRLTKTLGRALQRELMEMPGYEHSYPEAFSIHNVTWQEPISQLIFNLSHQAGPACQSGLHIGKVTGSIWYHHIKTETKIPLNTRSSPIH